eukprot:3948446-Prymnesium_polylepis.1
MTARRCCSTARLSSVAAGRTELCASRSCCIAWRQSGRTSGWKLSRRSTPRRCSGCTSWRRAHHNRTAAPPGTPGAPGAPRRTWRTPGAPPAHPAQSHNHTPHNRTPRTSTPPRRTTPHHGAPRRTTPHHAAPPHTGLHTSPHTSPHRTAPLLSARAARRVRLQAFIPRELPRGHGAPTPGKGAAVRFGASWARVSLSRMGSKRAERQTAEGRGYAKFEQLATARKLALASRGYEVRRGHLA